MGTQGCKLFQILWPALKLLLRAGESQGRPGESGSSPVTCVYECASLQSGHELQPTVTLPVSPPLLEAASTLHA